MYFHGSFVTQLGETVMVQIVTGNSRAQEVEIGGADGRLCFSDNPVEIQSSVNDTFDHLLRSEATIRLLARDFVPDFFCASCMDAVVNIYKEGKCIFAGFIEPQAYSQSYNEVYDELELSCIDVLSALQYAKYHDIGSAGVDYDTVKAAAGQRTFAEVITEILSGACASLDLNATDDGVQFWYDGSKALTSTSDRWGIFSQLAISELLFLGDDEDNVWQQDKVLESIFKYLNLHIVQDGLQFYVFSWESVKGDSAIVWHRLNGEGTNSITRKLVNIGLTNVAADDTTISIGEVYNQLQLACKVESIENVIESPLDDDNLTSPYTNRQLYMTEYSADMGDADKNTAATAAFYSMTHDGTPTYDGGAITDWFLQVRNNKHWIFPEPASGMNFIDKYCQNNTNQQTVPNLLRRHPGAGIFALGKVETKTDGKDNSLVAKVDMADCFVVSVNGNGKDNTEAYPTAASLQSHAPLAVYNGPTTGAVYSPSDDTTVNYIVLSGKIALNPLMDLSATYKELHNHTYREWLTGWNAWANPQPSRTSDKGRLYTQKYWKADTPAAKEVWDELTDHGLVPFTGTGPEQYEFKYSSAGDGTDRISKVAALACMLIIGDKCVVETGTQGQISDFEWRTYKTREQCASDDEYYQQCFTIGFDPKIGDKLIGTEFSLQNNIDYHLGIEAEGTAIRIRQSDKVSGAVRFMILGPVNSMWGEITRRHKTWFRSEKWYSDSIPLMAHVRNIILKSFEVKIYSNNGLINNTEDNDLVYLSDTDEKFVNRKDDIEFEISSALTSAERQQLGVTDSVKLSTPLDKSTGNGLLSIYDHNKQQQAKAEQLYVDSYYTEYHMPRVLMVQKLDDHDGNVGLFTRYKHPAMNDKTFYVQGISRNLIGGYAELTLKEVWND